jgi:hypothetical protein
VQVVLELPALLSGKTVPFLVSLIFLLLVEEEAERGDLVLGKRVVILEEVVEEPL